MDRLYGINCAEGAWAGFKDPVVPQSEEDQAFSLFQQLVDIHLVRSEQADILPLADPPEKWEKSTKNLLRFLRNNDHDPNKALKSYLEWLRWRRKVGADAITDEDIQHEVKDGLAAWRGQDKDGRLALVVTGRCLNPAERLGSVRSFQKFIIKTVEDGLKQADERDVEEVCIIYDRRGLEFRHLDSSLHRMSQPTISILQQWYRNRMGRIYIVSLNWVFHAVFMYILLPILGLMSLDKKIIVVEDSKELLEYFHEDQLFLLSYNEEEGTPSNNNEAPPPPPKVITPAKVRENAGVQIDR